MVLVVLIAVMLCGEVVARYVFNAPTIWTQDVSVVFQVWMTYLGMSTVLRQRQMIRIAAFASMAGPRVRKLLEAFTLVVILAFSAMAVYYAWGIVADSIRLDRRQPTMLEMPNWITEIPVVIGFAFLGLQALADLVRLPFGPAPDFSAGAEHSAEEESP
jgi:TRAP-type C4-dicarboxylate transport system permease small subunit